MTKRETFIQALLVLLRATQGLPATIERSLAQAYSREESPVLVVHRGGEDPDTTFLGATHRRCEIRVSVITRSDTPDQAADEVLELVHPLVMNFSAAGLMGVEEFKSDPPMYANGDGQACILTVRYLFLYRTQPESLST